MLDRYIKAKKEGGRAFRVLSASLVITIGLLGCATLERGAPAAESESLPPNVSGPTNNAGTPVTPKKTENITGPIPTNDWWSSLVFQRYPDNPYSNTMHAHPLAMKAEAQGLSVAYPNSYVITPDKRKYEYTYTPDFTLGVAGLTSPDAKLDGYSDWTVTAYWEGGGSSLTATFGHGLPYVYASKTGGDAQITFNGAPEVWANSGNIVGVSIRGHDYGVFAPAGSSWSVNGETLRSNLSGKDYFSVVALPDRSALNEFARHAFAFVIDTEVSYKVDNGEVITTYSATTEVKEGAETETLLALYRHQWLNSNAALTNYSYASARSEMKVLKGNSFSTSLTFSGVLPTLPDSGTYDRSRLAEYVRNADKAVVGADTYWFGKSVGRAGDLAHIAHQIGDVSARDTLLNGMKMRLEDWLTPGGDEFFAYDGAWGTLIGYPASFGSDTELNDHHFHYGYFVQAAADISLYDPAWVKQWKNEINDLILDAANPGRDERFPRLRNFDPYAGHSWAAGHAGFAAGNNNESSSEAINFATGLILWGSAVNDDEIRDLGIYLYATEVSAIEQYWFDVDDAVYPRDFRHPAVGMNWGDGGSYSTWFTAEPEMIQGINLLPIQPGSLYLGAHPDYIQTNWNHMVSENGGEPQVWQDIWWSFLALSDSQAAVQKFDANQNYEPEEGQSKAFTYHWIHTINTLGRPVTDLGSSLPTATAFDKEGTRTYVAYNPGDSAITVTYADGGRLEVPARSLATSRGGATPPPPPPPPSPEPPSPEPPSPEPPASGAVCFYEQPDYGGASFCAETDSDWVGAAWNDRISSLKVRAGYAAELFVDINYGGAAKTFTADTPELADLNNQPSSFRINRVAPPEPPSVISVPGLVTDNAGFIEEGSSKTWALSVTRAANLRLKLNGASSLNSRAITVSFAGRTVPLSFNTQGSLIVDFPGVAAGAQTLSIRANNDGVALSEIEFVTF